MPIANYQLHIVKPPATACNDGTAYKNKSVVYKNDGSDYGNATFVATIGRRQRPACGLSQPFAAPGRPCHASVRATDGHISARGSLPIGFHNLYLKLFKFCQLHIAEFRNFAKCARAGASDKNTSTYNIPAAVFHVIFRG